jgi:hypothetical protein
VDHAYVERRPPAADGTAEIYSLSHVGGTHLMIAKESDCDRRFASAVIWSFVAFGGA